jgi:prevent-host-death family protein
LWLRFCHFGGEMQVSVRELKNNLSKYLRLVKKGKPLIVTSRNVPLARVTAIPGAEGPGLKALLQREGVYWNGKRPGGGRSSPKVKGKTAAQLVLEDRR